MNEVKDLEYWKAQCFEHETQGEYCWQQVLKENSLFEATYGGEKINELVNKYGYDYVVKKFDEAKASKKTEEK